MPIPDYLIKNRQRIEDLPIQDLGTWNASYDNEAFDEFKIIRTLREQFPSKIIRRADIVNLFRNNQKYLGFVSSMVWGFINASRPRIKGGDRKTTNLYRALSHEQNKVEDAMKFAEEKFEKSDYRSPFEIMMSGKKYKIPGVDYRYYTKIFFFLGQAKDSIATKPLIFDKWTTNAFYALLSQSHPDDVQKYFRGVKDGNPGEAVVRSGKKLIHAYERFIKEMNQWAKEIDVSPDKLEQFVFGHDLRKEYINTNPRIELWEIISDNRQLV